MFKRFGLNAALRKILLSAVVALAAGCAHAPSAPLANDQLSATSPQALNNAARAAIRQEPGLLAANPADGAAFCPGYHDLSADGREAFWSAFVLAVANTESHGDAARVTWRAYDGAVARPTFRRGLMQISIEAANSETFHCAMARGADLTDPSINLACGVRILAEEVARDGVIAQDAAGRPTGAARYWPSLKRAVSRSGIAAATRAVQGCSGPA